MGVKGKSKDMDNIELEKLRNISLFINDLDSYIVFIKKDIFNDDANLTMNKRILLSSVVNNFRWLFIGIREQLLAELGYVPSKKLWKNGIIMDDKSIIGVVERKIHFQRYKDVDEVCGVTASVCKEMGIDYRYKIDRMNEKYIQEVGISSSKLINMTLGSELVSLAQNRVKMSTVKNRTRIFI